MSAYFSLFFLLANWIVIIRRMVSRAAGGRSTKECQFLIIRVKVESRQVNLSHISPKLNVKVTEVEVHCLCSLFPFFQDLSRILEATKKSKSSVLRK